MLAQVGSLMGLIVLEALVSRWKRPGRAWVSMVLTSKVHRLRAPKTNRGIPTIPAGGSDVGLINVSAVDT